MISVLGIPSLDNRHHDVQYRPGGIEKEERRNGGICTFPVAGGKRETRVGDDQKGRNTWVSEYLDR